MFAQNEALSKGHQFYRDMHRTYKEKHAPKQKTFARATNNKQQYARLHSHIKM